ncbi:MAG: serine hydrolase [Methanobacteriaceae archaeon]|jgi:CubicO group peptidase (beta-lactamase class C family)|nr:serine hydrolase [Methanobacteriaceae archaeon]OPX61009.1 MAG: beta-lactamase/D-alanine carboxypeptidase [Methanobacterium sp. PtaB.Bin024]OPY23183.1 MAG: beta-lactamase/D-alanine carboxypeptidase [Methanobacterium sp. PtaU1.Bin097]
MDDKVLGGIILILVIVAGVAGVLFYNSDFNNPGTDNNTKNTTNNNTASNDTTNTSTDQLALTLLPVNQPGNNPGPSPGPSPGPGPSPDPMDNIISLFDAYLKANYDQSLVPGMAVVIVQDGKIIYMNTLGVRDLASGEPVDKNTLFGIGSNTKPFSATNIGQLVSKGLMSWDDPIAKYFSVPDEFQLYSDYVSNNITIRDALCHRSGLPALDGDLIWAGFNQPYPYIMKNLRYRENSTPFRSTWQYNNLIYVIPSYAAARVAKTPWNELIKEDLLIPLGMRTSVTSYWDFLKTKNHAKPYYLLKNGTMMEYDIIPDSVGPAGSIYTSISEIANWLKFQIADTGYYNGVKILNKKELDETRTGQIKVNDQSQYGFGWGVLKDYITHAGGLDAFKSQVTVYPSKGLAIAVLANGGEYAGAYRTALDKKFRDLINGNYTSNPWSTQKKKAQDSLKPVPPTPPIIKPTLPLNGYTGTYSNKFYGNIKITTSNGALICYYGVDKHPFKLTHWNNNTYEEIVFNNYFEFSNIKKGKANQLTVKLSDSPENATFNRTKSA